MTGPGHGTYSVPDDVAWTSEPGEGGTLRIYVAPVPHGPVLVLEGSSAVIWQLAVTGPEAGLAERVGLAMDQPVDVVRDEVAAFVVHLVERGLLVAP